MFLNPNPRRHGAAATDVKIGIRSGRRAIDGGEARKSHIGMRMSLSPNADTASTDFESEFQTSY